MTLQVASLIRRSSRKQHGTENNRPWLSTCSQVMRPWRLKVQHGKPCHTFKKLDVPKHKFYGTKRVHIGACSTVIYYNQGATAKFSVLTLMSPPLFHNALEVARGKDQQRLKRLEEKSQKVEEQKKRKIEEATENEKGLHKGGAVYSAGKF